MRVLTRMSGTAAVMAPVRNRNAAAGDTAVHSTPARALAIRLAPACAVASSPNAEPRRLAGAWAATAADSAVSPQPMPSPARTNPAASRQGWRGPAAKTPAPGAKQDPPAAQTPTGPNRAPGRPAREPRTVAAQQYRADKARRRC